MAATRKSTKRGAAKKSAAAKRPKKQAARKSTSKRRSKKSTASKTTRLKRRAKKGLKAARGGLGSVVKAGKKTWEKLKSTTANVIG